MKILAAILMTFAFIPAHAAFITIDDSALNTITITAGDFEGGFSVNGTLLTSGLSNSNSITLADGVAHNFSGSFDLMQNFLQLQVFAFLEYVGLAGLTYSGVQLIGTAGGFFGAVSGEFSGFDPLVFHGPVIGVGPQDGSTFAFDLPYFSTSFKSEASVSEPGTIALLGLGLVGLGFAQRKKA